MTLILVIVAVFLIFGGGGWFAGPGPYRSGGWGIGGILLLVLVIWLLTGGRF